MAAVRICFLAALSMNAAFAERVRAAASLQASADGIEAAQCVASAKEVMKTDTSTVAVGNNAYVLRIGQKVIAKVDYSMSRWDILSCFKQDTVFKVFRADSDAPNENEGMAQAVVRQIKERTRKGATVHKVLQTCKAAVTPEICSDNTADCEGGKDCVCKFKSSCAGRPAKFGGWKTCWYVPFTNGGEKTLEQCFSNATKSQFLELLKAAVRHVQCLHESEVYHRKTYWDHFMTDDKCNPASVRMIDLEIAGTDASQKGPVHGLNDLRKLLASKDVVSFDFNQMMQNETARSIAEEVRTWATHNLDVPDDVNWKTVYSTGTKVLLYLGSL